MIYCIKHQFYKQLLLCGEIFTDFYSKLMNNFYIDIVIFQNEHLLDKKLRFSLRTNDYFRKKKHVKMRVSNMIHQAIEEGLYAIMYCSPQLKLHWETMTTDQQYCNKYFIDLHYNFILLFGHRKNQQLHQIAYICSDWTS